MTPPDAMELARASLMLALTVTGPLLLTALVVGVGVSLFQALTQVQEQTLTFVPKLAAMGLVLLFWLPMIGAALADFASLVSDRIVHG
jgi:flagellar biosynthetic protein FliQ